MQITCNSSSFTGYAGCSTCKEQDLNRLRPPRRQEYANAGPVPYSFTFQQADRWRIFVPGQGFFQVGIVDIALATGRHITLDGLDTRMRSVLHQQRNNVVFHGHRGRTFVIQFRRPIDAFGHTGIRAIRFAACYESRSAALQLARRRPRA